MICNPEHALYGFGLKLHNDVATNYSTNELPLIVVQFVSQEYTQTKECGCTQITREHVVTEIGLRYVKRTRLI